MTTTKAKTIVTDQNGTKEDKGNGVLVPFDLSAGDPQATDIELYQSIRTLLSEPFPQELISYREGFYNPDTKKKEQLKYVNVREYEKRLNNLAFGHWESMILENNETQRRIVPSWYDETQRKRVFGEPYMESGTVMTIRTTIYGVPHDGVSQFEVDPTNAYSSAFKRSLLPHGMGAELYDKDLVGLGVAEEGSQIPQRTQTPTTQSRPQTQAPAQGEVAFAPPTASQLSWLIGSLRVPEAQARELNSTKVGPGTPFYDAGSRFGTSQVSLILDALQKVFRTKGQEEYDATASQTITKALQDFTQAKVYGLTNSDPD